MSKKQSNKNNIQLLFEWCQRITKGYANVSVKNWTKSFEDGIAFLAILHHFRATLVPDIHTLRQGENADANLQRAFDLGFEHFGIEKLLGIEDMHPSDDKANKTYLIEMHGKLSKVKREESNVNEEEMEKLLSQVPVTAKPPLVEQPAVSVAKPLAVAQPSELVAAADKQPQDVPVVEKVVQAAPINETVAQTAPVNETVVQTAPVDKIVAQTAPINETVAQITPVDEKVVQTAPVDKIVAQTAPVNETVVQITPVDEKVAQSAITQEKGIDEQMKDKVEPVDVTPVVPLAPPVEVPQPQHVVPTQVAEHVPTQDKPTVTPTQPEVSIIEKESPKVQVEAPVAVVPPQTNVEQSKIEPTAQGEPKQEGIKEEAPIPETPNSLEEQVQQTPVSTPPSTLEPAKPIVAEPNQVKDHEKQLPHIDEVPVPVAQSTPVVALEPKTKAEESVDIQPKPVTSVAEQILPKEIHEPETKIVEKTPAAIEQPQEQKQPVVVQESVVQPEVSQKANEEQHEPLVSKVEALSAPKKEEEIAQEPVQLKKEEKPAPQEQVVLIQKEQAQAQATPVQKQEQTQAVPAQKQEQHEKPVEQPPQKIVETAQKSTKEPEPVQTAQCCNGVPKYVYFLAGGAVLAAAYYFLRRK